MFGSKFDLRAPFMTKKIPHVLDFPFEMWFRYRLWYWPKVLANLGFSFGIKLHTMDINYNSGFGRTLNQQDRLAMDVSIETSMDQPVNVPNPKRLLFLYILWVRVLCAKPKHDDHLWDPLIADEVSQQTMSRTDHKYL